MSNLIEVDGRKYELIKDYKEAFDLEDFTSKCTDYFKNYDYIVGDIAYGKLRLKGFYDASAKWVKKINNFDKVDEYLANRCAVDCKYFIVKRSKENE